MINLLRKKYRRPSATKLIELDFDGTLPPSGPNRQTNGANSYRNRILINRSGSLDRLTQNRSRRKFVTNAWTRDKVAYSVTSPSSSNSSWDGFNNGYPINDPNRQAQATRRLQNRIQQLEGLLKSQNDTAPFAYNDVARGLNSDPNNHLLQRVVRLQAELHRKELEIDALKDQMEPTPNISYIKSIQTALDNSEREKTELQINLSRAQDALINREQRLKAMVEKQDGEKELFDKNYLEESFKMHDDLKRSFQNSARLLEDSHTVLEIYRSYLDSVAGDLTELTDKMSDMETHDYADIFDAIAEKLSEPFDNIMTNFESRCREKMLAKGYRNDQLKTIDSVLKEANTVGLKPIAEQMGLILPIVREAALAARDSAKVCYVFSEWSRELGDRIRTDGLTSDILIDCATDLTDRFAEKHLREHWLLPSITPLLRVAALDYRDRVEMKFNNRVDEAVSTDLSLTELEHHEERLKELESVANRSTDDRKKIESELQSAKVEKSSTATELDEVKREYKQLQNDFSELEEKCMQYAHTNETLKMELDQIIMKQNGYESEAGLLREKLKIAENQNADMEQAHSAEVDSLRQKLADAIEQVSRTRTANEGQEGGSNTEREELEALRRKLEELEGVSAESKAADISAEDTDKEQEIFELREKLIAAEKAKEDLEKAVNMNRYLRESVDNSPFSTNDQDMNGRKFSFDDELRDREQSFWELSQRLANMLDVDLKRNDPKPLSSGRFDPMSVNDMLTTRKENINAAAEEITRSVEEVLKRVRQQNEELATHRSQDGALTSHRNDSSRKSSAVSDSRNGDIRGSQKRTNSSSHARAKRNGLKKDLPMKVVTFELPVSSGHVS
uniref:Uncharacterized protein n=1 Tax=Plectus sambesii TaxID=2011161 RepID=A0A914WE02_9BILA